MTEKEQTIAQAFTDLKEWMQALQSKELSETESKLLFAVRDLAKGIKPAVPAPAPAPKPAPRPFNYMEATSRELFERLENKRDVMTPDHLDGYIRLRKLFEADGRSGVSLPWEGIDFLRQLYGTYFFSRR